MTGATKLSVLFILWFGLQFIAIQEARSQSAQEAQPPAWTPPPRVDSPDQRFSVEIRDNTDPSAKYDADRLLIISDHGRPIAEHKTFGFLLDVFWSDDQDYVAINNRRGNAGDQVWVFSLPDGKCIKTADSKQFDFLEHLASKAFKHLDNRALPAKLEKEWIYTKGWWKGNKLLVRVECRYGFLIGRFPAHFIYDAEVRVSDSNFAFASGEARKRAYPTDEK